MSVQRMSIIDPQNRNPVRSDCSEETSQNIEAPDIQHRRSSGKSPTSENTTLLEVVHTLARIALAQFLADQTRHHAADPLLTDNGVAGVVDCDVVLEVDAVVGRGDGGLFGEEGGGLGGWHCGWLGCAVQIKVRVWAGGLLLAWWTMAARVVGESRLLRRLDAVVGTLILKVGLPGL